MDQTITVALAGNPNAGKTTIFNALTGSRQHVGNWPGVTVEKKEGALKHAGRTIHVIDLPGTYSLTAYSTEELIARNFIVESAPDVVIAVVDASNLERNLYLATQLLEMGVEVVIALNMIDVATGRGIRVDADRLGRLLGVPVIPTNGKKGVGIEDLLDAAVSCVDEARPPPPRRVNFGTEIEEEVAKIQEHLTDQGIDLSGLRPRWVALKLLEGDPDITAKVQALVRADGLFRQVDAGRQHLQNIFEDSPDILFADARYGFVSGAVRLAVSEERADRIYLSENLDMVLTNRLLGPIILLVVLYGVYIFTFQGSEPLVAVLEHFFAWLGERLSAALPEGLLRSLLVSGIIDGVGGVLGFTPLIAFMFFAIAILEDTGYMARIAFMLDRVLRGFGLHGASMLALMVSGGLAGGCAVPGIMATRTLKEPKERLVTILVAPLMNCGAKLPVYALLIGAFFPGKKAPMMFLLTIVSWTMALLAGRVIRSTVLAGPSAPFVLELPPYRLPTLKALLIHTWERTWMYVKKAGTVILAISILLWAMMTFPGLPEHKARPYQKQETALESQLLAEPAVAEVLHSRKDLAAFETLLQEDSGVLVEAGENITPQMIDLAERVNDIRDTKDESGSPDKPGNLTSAAKAYLSFAGERANIRGQLQTVQLQHTIGGRVGLALEWVFHPIGFEWKTCIALVGGFAAKEVVVSTLGTAYSLGEIESAQPATLEEKLKREPAFSPLMAVSLILFVMLYAPCFVTLVVIKKETGRWAWSLFAMIYTTLLAYCVALAVKTAGVTLGLGVS